MAILRLLQGRMARNALSLYAVQGLNFLLPLIILPYLLRVLSPRGYGSIVFAQALMGYAVLFTDFGFNLTSARDISVARDNPREIARVFWITMASKCVLLLVSLLAIGAVIAVNPNFREDWQVFAACGLLVIGNVAFPAWYFQGLEKLREVAVAQAISKIVIAGSTFIFVKSPQDKLLAAFLMSSPQLIGAAISVALKIPLVPGLFYRPTFANVRDALKESSHLFIGTAATSLYLHTNTFVLGLMSGERAVAFYSLGYKLVLAIQNLTAPVTQAVFPRASMLFAENPRKAWHLIGKISWVLLPAIGFVSLLMAVFAPQIVMLFGGAGYAAAVPVMRIMAAVPLLLTIAGILAQIVMVNIGLTKQLVRIFLAVGVFNLLILPGLIFLYSANGAAISLTIAETLGPALMIYVLWKRGALAGAWRDRAVASRGNDTSESLAARSSEHGSEE